MQLARHAGFCRRRWRSVGTAASALLWGVLALHAEEPLGGGGAGGVAIAVDAVSSSAGSALGAVAKKAPRSLSSSAVDARSVSAPPRPGASRTQPGWVTVESLRPSPLEEEVLRNSRLPDETRPWFLLERQASDFEAPPPYASYRPAPLFYIPPAPETRYSQALRSLVYRKVFSEVRRKAKRAWKQAYHESPNMDFSVYEQRLYQIHQIGKDSEDFDLFGSEYFRDQLKEELLDRPSREAESDIALFAWGPFVVTDRGSMRVDIGRVVDFPAFLEKPERVEIEDEKTARKAFLADENFRVHTSLKLSVDPVEVARGGDAVRVFKRYGVALDVEWLSDVLGREMVTAELEAEMDRDGDFGVLLSFVIRSRE